MCKVLEVSRSGYYDWKKRKKSLRAKENELFERLIKELFDESKASYGSNRICKILNKQGYSISRGRVRSIMRRLGLSSKLKPKYTVTTDSKHNFLISEDLVERNFKPGTLNKIWVSDITYIHTNEGWLYLTIVMDLGDRKIIGWAMSDSLHASKTSMEAWKMACKNRKPAEGLIFHSDRGTQYACHEFRREIAKQKGIRQSMSRKGDCWDNAVAESFFKTIKQEWLKGLTFTSRKEAQKVVFEFIEAWYNTRRAHQTLGYLSPAQYEQKILEAA